MVKLPKSDEIDPIIMWRVPPLAKGSALQDVIHYYQTQGIAVEKENVHFFDDNPKVVQAYYNHNPTSSSNQVSCPSKTDPSGRCGASFSDIVLGSPGIRTCPKQY
jgi:hypothetical protein